VQDISLDAVSGCYRLLTGSDNGIVAIAMTLSDLQGHAPNAVILQRDFSESCAAADKISTDTVRRAVPLR